MDDYAGFVVGSDNRPLSSLRVIDLKSELEKRGLSKSGSKKDLLERLKRQLQLEKLQESAQHNADRVPNLSLQDDAIGTQNEVVKAYLAAQQKTYELQKEARRQIELSADEVGVSDTDASSSQDEGLTPTKSVIQRRSHQPIGEIKQAEVVSSEVEEAEDLAKDSEKQDVISRSQTSLTEKNLPEPVRDAVIEKVINRRVSSEAQNISEEEAPNKTDVTSDEEVENFTVKPLEVNEEVNVQNEPEIVQSEQPVDDSTLSNTPNTEPLGNRLVDITESEMAVAIESISGIAPISYSLETVEVPVAMDISNEENINESQGERKPLTEEPTVDEVPAIVAPEVLRVNDNPESKAADMVKENKGSIETRSKKIEKLEIKEENSVDNNAETKVKLEVATGDQPVDLSFDESHDGRVKEKKIERKTSAKKENLNGSPVKEVKNGSDTENESQCSDKRSRSRSPSTDSRSSSASFHSESGSFSSPRRKKRVRNTDSEASSTSEDEAEAKRRGKTDAVSPKTVVKTESGKESNPVTKRRKWTSAATESNSPVERRKINRCTISVVESELKPTKIESEEAEDTNDKKDLVLDLHATDETMEVSDAEKESTDNKVSSIKKIEKETSAGTDSTLTQESSDKVKKITSRKISLSGSTPKEEDSSKPQRKRKWGSITKVVPVSSPVISTESLKGLIPDLTPALSAATKIEDIVAKPPPTKEIVTNNVPNKIEIKMNKDDEESGLPRDISPARKPVSNILYVRNLVRPFTLNQLKEVLNKTGTMVEDGFWIDKIKSKCYVTYESEEQAVETRLALHGTRWPMSNPKTLFVDFSTTEELEFHKGGGKPIPPVPQKVEPIKEHRPKESLRKVSESSATSDRTRRVSTGDKDDKKHHDRDRDRSSGRNRTNESSNKPATHPVREWDRDKLVQDDNRRYRDRDRERSGRSRENDKPRSKERKDRKDKKVETKKKQEEETPGKLLDDLFRKTKAMPCIYWLPLTEQQIVQRDEQRKQRMLEREKRRQRMEQEERERMETERKLRLKERETRMARDRNASRRSRSASRSPIRRR